MKLGFLGPRGTFSFEAAKSYSTESELIEYRTITEAILALKANEIDEAIVPIENSIQGGVTETIDALIANDNIYVIKDFTIKISHNLMANNKYQLHEIKEVYSHPQAIAQCRNYIEKNLINAHINQVSSTAYAAKEIKNKDFCACIANISCIDEYNLTLLDSNVQDNDLNETKFWVLNKSKNTKVGTEMSIIFSCKHQAGALYHVLRIFDNNKINLTKIESRPAKTVLGSYIFLVDLEVNSSIDKALDLLKKECNFLKVLGTY